MTTELVHELIHNELHTILSYLNVWITTHMTKYLASNQLTIADFAVINHLIDLGASKVNWKDGCYPDLEKYFDRMIQERPIIIATPSLLLDKIN